MSELGTTGDYYSILGVDRDACINVVRTSYRRLMQKAGNHPDLGGDTQTAALINKAYAVLSNPILRGEYDAQLGVLEQVSSGIAVAPAPNAVDPARQCLFCEQPHDYGSHDLEEFACDTCGSPLQSIERLRMEPGGQRAVQRLGQSLELAVFTHWSQKKGVAARTEDVSLHGLRMVARCDLRLGQRVRLVSSKLDAVAEVVYCAPGHSSWRRETIAGLTFLTLRFDRRVGVFVACQI